MTKIEVLVVMNKRVTVGPSGRHKAENKGSIPNVQIARRLEVWGYTNKACLRRL
jgi:hypothetical protein